MAMLISVDKPVTRSEMKMLESLRSSLPTEWYVLGNIQVSFGIRTREVDAIVIGDQFIWVVDGKDIGGRIRGDEHEWILDDGSVRERVLDNVFHAASMVKGQIGRRLSHLKSVWVEALVILTNPSARLEVVDERVSHHVVELTKCADYFLAAHPRKSLHLSSDTRKEVVRALIGDRAFERLSRGDSRHPTLRLENEVGFRRVYYEDVIIDRNELRGATHARVNSINGFRLSVSFDEGRISLELLDDRTESWLNGRPLKLGRKVDAGDGRSELKIGPVSFSMTVEQLTKET